VFVADCAAPDTTRGQQQQQQQQQRPTASMTSADDEEQAPAADGGDLWDANAEDLATICGSSLDNDDEDRDTNLANINDQTPP